MNTTIVLIFAAFWIATGVVTGLWMIRRGHDPLWMLVALAFGPLFVPIALERVERSPRLATAGPWGESTSQSSRSDGPRVLVGLDGSPQSEQVLATTLWLFGHGFGMLVLAEVVHYDATMDASGREVDAAKQRLAGAAAAAGELGVVAQFEVLAGPAGEALRRFAEDQEMDVLVVGRRGGGLSTRLLGSVSSDLVHHSPVPVLVVEPARSPATTDSPSPTNPS